jgi:hypothetical protein
VILQALGKTAIKWLLIAVAFVILLSAINYGLSFVPFTPQFNAKRTAAKADRLEGQVSTLEREAAGQAEIATATETFHTRETVIREVQSQADREARSAPDAETPLPDERLARHLRNDERVCDGASFTCATLDAPLGGVGAVPTDDARG